VSTALGVEVTTLDELNLESVPPCEILFVNLATGHEFPCGKPSVIRMHLSCPGCARVSTRFLCQKCYDDLRNAKLACWYCFTKTGKAPRNITYRES
jgi:hypothetical protein